MNEGKKLEFKLNGAKFNNEYNLYYLSENMRCFQSLIDKAYLHVKDRQRMTDKDRDLIQIKTTNIRDGSFLADMTIVMTNTAPALIPAFTSLTPNGMWKLVTEGYNFLIAVLKANKAGEKMYTEVGDGNTTTVVNGDGNVIFNVQNDVLEYLKRSESDYEKIARMVNPNIGFNGLSVVDKESRNQELNISSEEKQLFQSKEQLEEIPVTFIGNIYDANGDGFKGKLRVTDTNDDISAGEYPFEFISKNDQTQLRSSFLVSKSITALKETTLNLATLEKKVKRLLIISTNELEK